MLWAAIVCVHVLATEFSDSIHPWKLITPVTTVNVAGMRIMYARATIGWGTEAICMTTRPVPPGPLPTQSMYYSKYKPINCFITSPQ